MVLLSHFDPSYSIWGTFYNNLSKRGGWASPPRTMDPDLFLLNKMLKASINSFVDIFDETYIFLNIYYIIELIIE